jgi:phosphatidylinositol kinase/protein kinase (PI-3  family)
VLKVCDLLCAPSSMAQFCCPGVFRRSSEITVGVLRANIDALMSVLETFVHDPLVEWNTRKRVRFSSSSFSTSTFHSVNRPMH